MKPVSLFSVLLTGAIVSIPALSAAKAPITEECVHGAQAAWGQAIVEIGAASVAEGGDAKATAQRIVETLYHFQGGDVLFKPTVATAPQFRLNHKDALSYFVTGHIEEDKGFALRPWTNVRFENATIRIFGDVALAMGNYFFTCSEGNTIKVEYTKGYVRDEEGNLRIILQHSSLPFNPES
jgi:hypothetical protein